VRPLSQSRPQSKEEGKGGSGKAERSGTEWEGAESDSLFVFLLFACVCSVQFCVTRWSERDEFSGSGAEERGWEALLGAGAC